VLLLQERLRNRACNEGVVRKETETTGLGVTVMVVLTYLKVQSTRTQLKIPKIKAQGLIRTCPHSAQVALRVKTRTE